MYDTRKLSKVYNKFKSCQLNIKQEEENLNELLEIDYNIKEHIKELKNENENLQTNIEKINIIIEEQDRIISEYKKYMSEYSSQYGNIIDKILFYSEKIPILNHIIALLIGMPYLFLQMLAYLFNSTLFDESRYYTDEQKSKLRELYYVLKEPSKEVSENKQIVEHNKLHISELENRLLKLSCLLSIKICMTHELSKSVNCKKLYYIRLIYNNTYFYKIGITKYNVFTRYSQDTKNMNIDKVIFEIDCNDAEEMEQEIIDLNRDYRLYKLGGRYLVPGTNEELLDSGNSEIFNEDILSIDFLKKDDYDNLSIIQYKDEEFDEQIDIILDIET